MTPLPGDLSTEETIHRMIRVDHAGEYGAARIYAPGFDINAVRENHPLVRDNKNTNAAGKEDAGAFRRLLCQKICAMSVGTKAELKEFQ